MPAGLTTKDVKDGLGADFTALVWDDGTAKITPTSYVPDGYHVTIGAIADAAWSGTGSGTVVAIQKAIYGKLAGTVAISAAALPLPTGAATAAKQPAIGTAGTPSADVLSIQGIPSMTPLIIAGNTTTTAVGAANPISVKITDGTNPMGIVNGSMARGQSASPSGWTRVAAYGWRFNGTSVDPDYKPNQTSRLLSSAATTNATSVKASAGELFEIIGSNTVASKRYLKLYNKASAPTVGTDTPVLTLVIPASASFSFRFTAQYFSTGIAYAITGAAADADTTAIGSGDIECLNMTYA